MILVIGSINMDLVMPVARFPAPGETIITDGGQWQPGGKGANQALAAARMGEKTALVGQVGDDVFGERLVLGLRTQGVVTSAIGRAAKPTGIAAVLCDSQGENSIVVSTGANDCLKPDQVPDEILRPDTVLLASLEVPIDVVTDIFMRAHKRGAKTLLNVAPYRSLPDDLLRASDLIIVNKGEAAQLGDVLTAKNHIVTQGAQGATYYAASGDRLHVPALSVKVIDTTGAGDCYCGTLAGCLKLGLSLAVAMRHASVAASLACTKMGAQSAYPYLAEIEENLPRLTEESGGDIHG